MRILLTILTTIACATTLAQNSYDPSRGTQSLAENKTYLNAASRGNSDYQFQLAQADPCGKVIGSRKKQECRAKLRPQLTDTQIINETLHRMAMSIRGVTPRNAGYDHARQRPAQPDQKDRYEELKRILIDASRGNSESQQYLGALACPGEPCCGRRVGRRANFECVMWYTWTSMSANPAYSNDPSRRPTNGSWWGTRANQYGGLSVAEWGARETKYMRQYMSRAQIDSARNRVKACYQHPMDRNKCWFVGDARY